jgi:hypothetical protein
MNRRLPYGFRIVGGVDGPRQLVDYERAYQAYADCALAAGVEQESFLSAFQFGEDFRQQLETARSTKGFRGECWTRRLPFDIDREGDLQSAFNDARRLAASLLDRYPQLDEEQLLLFFSGGKGFNIELPLSLCGPLPASPEFHRVGRALASELAMAAEVKIDTSVYTKVQPLRAPNSRHGKSGLHKRCLKYDELMHLSVGAILKLAETPEAFEVPDDSRPDDRAVADWAAAQKATASRGAPVATSGGKERRLNRETLEFIREGASPGERAIRLFRAAANLGELGCPLELAVALLDESARNLGLAPREIRRQIECGLAYARDAAVEPAIHPRGGDQKGNDESRPTTTTCPSLMAQMQSLWRQQGEEVVR